MSVGQQSAIIDIGSNSVRLVVYNGPKRAPAVLFNEKVMAGLGAGLAETAELTRGAMSRAINALARYQAVIAAMQVSEVRVVATAAVREARNADVFLARVADLGLNVEVLSGAQEASAAGYGVLSAIPDADGIVGDLGGGSLELVRISNGQVHACVSLPLGVLRLRTIIAKGPNALEAHIGKTLRAAGWSDCEARLPLYLVGGSWRTLARFHMRMGEFALPVLHNYTMPADACAEIVWNLDRIGPREAKAISAISASRLPTLGDAAKILAVISSQLKSSQLIVSAHGLREGLLFERLSPAERAIDPLIAAAREEGARQSRFAEHGDLLNTWIAPLFADEDAASARLRHAACLLSDVSWKANPDFRAERGVDVALHGNWIAIDSAGRAVIAQALFTNFGGGQLTPTEIAHLADPQALVAAVRWGLAMRFGQRLSGGVAEPLAVSSLAVQGQRLVLRLPHAQRGLVGDVVERRHKALAAAFGLHPAVEAL